MAVSTIISPPKLGNLCVAFAGATGGPSSWWTPLLADVQAAIALGIGKISLPVSITSDLNEVTSLVKLIKSQGLKLHIVPHFDGNDATLYGLILYQNPTQYESWFQQLLNAVKLGGFTSGDTIELWNEAGYTAGSLNAQGKQITWPDVVTLYSSVAPALAAMIRVYLPVGSLIVLPGPIDQSDTSIALSWQIGLQGLFNNKLYDLLGMHFYTNSDWGGNGADSLGWPVPGSLTLLRNRLSPVEAISEQCGLRVIVTECGPPTTMPGYLQWGTDVAREFSDRNWEFILWDWHDGLPAHDYRSYPQIFTAMNPTRQVSFTSVVVSPISATEGIS